MDKGRRALDSIHCDPECTNVAASQDQLCRDAGVIERGIATLTGIPVFLGPEQDRLRRTEATGAQLIDIQHVLRTGRESRISKDPSAPDAPCVRSPDIAEIASNGSLTLRAITLMPVNSLTPSFATTRPTIVPVLRG